MAPRGQEELVELLLRAVPEEGPAEPIQGVHLYRACEPNEPLHSVYDPVFCIVAQGSKEIYLGDEHYTYDPDHYLLVTTELPLVAQIGKASRSEPYLSFRLDLDPAVFGSVMVEAGVASPPKRARARAIHVSAVDEGLLDAVIRLLRAAETPSQAGFMAPLITREIVFRLWHGEQGERLGYIAAQNGYTPHVTKAIQRIHDGFDQPIKIEDLAQDLGMSVSGFHHQFKAVTAMSPLQFQKRIRLQEARRLMLGEGLDASGAAYRVGYNDASQFSREYKRQFGLPPVRDVERLREMAVPDGISVGE